MGRKKLWMIDYSPDKQPDEVSSISTGTSRCFICRRIIPIDRAIYRLIKNSKMTRHKECERRIKLLITREPDDVE